MFWRPDCTSAVATTVIVAATATAAALLDHHHLQQAAQSYQRDAALYRQGTLDFTAMCGAARLEWELSGFDPGEKRVLDFLRDFAATRVEGVREQSAWRARQLAADAAVALLYEQAP